MDAHAVFVNFVITSLRIVQVVDGQGKFISVTHSQHILIMTINALA